VEVTTTAVTAVVRAIVEVTAGAAAEVVVFLSQCNNSGTEVETEVITVGYAIVAAVGCFLLPSYCYFQKSFTSCSLLPIL